jgi:hypothetical protein
LIFKVKVQGQRVKFLGEGIRHALRCPCFILFFACFIWDFLSCRVVYILTEEDEPNSNLCYYPQMLRFQKANHGVVSLGSLM